MRKLYEIFKVLKIQKRIVSTETIRGNTVAKTVIFRSCTVKRCQSGSMSVRFEQIK